MQKILIAALGFVTLGLLGCSTNPATGKQQFTALMPASQENQIGASEHQKVAEQFGFYDDPKVVGYVNEIGRKIVPHTERGDVQYKFYVIDSPIVNAFALPGGYIYISRGLLALANNEAEVAAVLSHEVGHITGRHSAERYSTAAVTSLGANILSIALDGGAATNQAIGLGTNLYLSSYSRSQETEADSLGLRYMTKAGYNPAAMPRFLSSLQAQSGLEARIDGKQQGFSYLSTHPATSDRVSATLASSNAYPQSGTTGEDTHMRVIDGMVFGDSAKQGFTKGQTFYHPDIGFAFDTPSGFKIENQPEAVVATHTNGSAIVFDIGANKGRLDPATYLHQIWIKGEAVQNPQNITVNGMNAATATFSGRVNGKPAMIRLIAIEFEPEKVARFQIAIPQGASSAAVEDLKRASYSFRRLTAQEKSSLRPKQVRIITAGANDSIESLARHMPFDKYNEDQFRVLNALVPGEALKPGNRYKTITQ